MLRDALVITFRGGGRCYSFPFSRDGILGVDWVGGGGHHGRDPISKCVGKAIDIGFIAASGSWSGCYWCRDWIKINLSTWALGRQVSIKGSQDLSGRIMMDEKRVPSESFNLKEVRKTHMIYKAFDLST